METKIVIGRDGATRQLKITVGQQSQSIGQAGSVPMSVSREHCRITAVDGNCIIENLNPNNVTYINGTPVQKKHITENDTIALGAERYPLSWSCISQLLPKVADIRGLKAVWDEYDKTLLQLQIDERKFNAWRGITPIISFSALLLGFFTGRENPWLWVLYGSAILLSVVFLVVSYRKSTSVPKKQKESKTKFQNSYVCPHCHHFMGYTDYKLIIQNEACPYCKARYKK